MASLKPAAKRDVSLARALSKLGYTSRSQAVELIEQGHVKVNGRTIRFPAFRCSLVQDRITVNDRLLKKSELVYIILNKPVGIVTTRSDEKGRRTVYDILGDVGRWVFPVGRLDKETSGLLLLTNDTQFGERITNPGSKITKTYRVRVDRTISDEDLETFRRGMELGKERLLPAKVTRLTPDAFELTITEGKNRQVRRMCEELGFDVKELKRIALGKYHIGNLKPGEWRNVKPEEITGEQRVHH